MLNIIKYVVRISKILLFVKVIFQVIAYSSSSPAEPCIKRGLSFSNCKLEWDRQTNGHRLITRRDVQTCNTRLLRHCRQFGVLL